MYTVYMSHFPISELIFRKKLVSSQFAVEPNASRARYILFSRSFTK